MNVGSSTLPSPVTKVASRTIPDAKNSNLVDVASDYQSGVVIDEKE